MNNNERQHHKKVKLTLKIIGISLIVVGLILAIIGFVDFTSAMSGDDMPTRFWCIFVGMPIMMIGVSLTVFGFKRELATYMKNESVPVINETGKELKPAISSIAESVKDVIEDNDTITCTCGTVNDRGSKFCKKCGAPLERKCPNCGEDIDPDSTFCNHCGTKIE